jgi:osmotically-inducible protein OsmY
LIAGCGDYAGGQQTSVSANESREAPNRGSATDIARQGESPTNQQNAADIGIGGPVQREAGNYQSQPVRGQASDEELAKQIKVALTTGSTGTTGTIAEDRLTAIQVQVRDGNVTLTGPAADVGEKESIGKQVSSFKGVKSVRNELTVGGRAVQYKPLQPLVPRGAGNE